MSVESSLTQEILEASLLPSSQLFLLRNVAQNALNNSNVINKSIQHYARQGVVLTADDMRAIYQNQLNVYQGALDLIAHSA